MSTAKTILIVDDSRITRLMIRSIIESNFPDWHILEAANGNEALAVVDGNEVDVMTLDMNMPGMDGVTLGVELRKRFPNAEISLVTANIQQAVHERAREAAMIFVPKPVTEERILSYLNSVA